MPAYELLCMLPAAMPKEEIAKRMVGIGRMVFGSGGVLMNVRSYGVNQLGYEVKSNFRKNNEAFMYGMDVSVGNDGLKELQKALRYDKEVLRWLVLRKSLKPHYDARVIKMRDAVEDGRLVEELEKLKLSSK